MVLCFYSTKERCRRENFLPSIIIGDEAAFAITKDGEVNSHNVRNPVFTERTSMLCLTLNEAIPVPNSWMSHNVGSTSAAIPVPNSLFGQHSAAMV